MENEKKGLWIPLWVWQAQQLTLQEKALLAEIHGLDSTSAGCFASNAYLAEFMGVGQDRVSKLITSLKRKGMIQVELANEGQNTTRRTIKMNREKIPTWQEKGIGENTQGVWADTPRGYRQKHLGGIGENTYHINKDISKVEKEEAPAFDFLKSKDAIAMEAWEMNHHKQIEEYARFKMDFNDTVTQEQLPYSYQVLYARLNKYARAWISNQRRWGKSDPQKNEPIPPWMKKVS